MDGHRLITNWDVSCPHCRAGKDQPCRRPNGDKFTTVQGTVRFHAARVRAAGRAR